MYTLLYVVLLMQLEVLPLYSGGWLSPQTGTVAFVTAPNESTVVWCQNALVSLTYNLGFKCPISLYYNLQYCSRSQWSVWASGGSVLSVCLYQELFQNSACHSNSNAFWDWGPLWHSVYSSAVPLLHLFPAWEQPHNKRHWTISRMPLWQGEVRRSEDAACPRV